MRVCHVISGIDIDNGGPPVALGGLATAQARIGMQVSVLSTYRFPEKSFAVAKDWETQGVQVRLIGPAKEPMSRHPMLTRAAEEMCDSHDILHIHSMWESIQHHATRAAYRKGTPYVYRPSGMLDPWNMTKGTLRKKLYLALRARTNLNRAAALHFTSTIERDWVKRLNLTAPSIVEPLGMNFGEYQTLPPAGSFRGRYPSISDRPVVIFLGRIHRGKGLELLIPAVAQMKERRTMLMIAGPDGNFRGEADALIAHHGLADRVIFTGLITGPDKVAALADADLLALPSYHENFGLVVVEALAAGTPAVVSDQVGLHPDVSAAGVGGVVPMSIEALAAELDRWIADEPRRRAAGEKARVWVRQRYDWDQIATRWLGHYRRIVEGLGAHQPAGDNPALESRR